MILNLESNLAIILGIQRYLEPFLFILTTFLLYYKFHHISMQNRPQLNKLLLFGMGGWSIYSLLDIIIFNFAWESIPPSEPVGIYSGYLIQYPLLFWANVLRDFAIGGAMIMNWSFLIAAHNIHFGELRTRKIFFENRKMLLFEIVSTLVLIGGDMISVTVHPEGFISASSAKVGLGAIFLIITVCFYIFAGGMLLKVFQNIMFEDQDPKFKHRLRLISAGIISMGIGDLYWGILSIFKYIYPVWFNSAINWMTTSFVGHLFWILCPISFLIGLRFEKKT